MSAAFGFAVAGIFEAYYSTGAWQDCATSGSQKCPVYYAWMAAAVRNIYTIPHFTNTNFRHFASLMPFYTLLVHVSEYRRSISDKLQ
jgi:hypothetical protein